MANEEDPKQLVESELRRPEVQKLLRENLGREGTQHNSREFKAGYAYAFELSKAQRAMVDALRANGVTTLEAMQSLGLLNE